MRVSTRAAGERIDRSQPIAFTFDGKTVQGFAGDTIGSALYAAGQRVFSRSFKYHRPRGLVVLLRPLRQLPDDGRRDPERARLHDAAREGAVVKGAELPRLARARPDAGDRQARRPVHAARLLLQDLHPARASSGRSTRSSSAAPPGSARSTRTDRAQERVDVEHRHVDVARDRWRPGRPRGGDRRGAGGRLGRRDRRGLRRRRRAASPTATGSATAAELRRARRRAPASRSSLPRSRSALFEQGLVPVAYGNLLIKFRARPRRRRERASSSSRSSSRATTSSA